MKVTYYINIFVVFAVSVLTIWLLYLLVKPSPSFATPKSEIVLHQHGPVRLDPEILANSALALSWTPPSLSLPDVRPFLHYYGPVLRPDATTAEPAILLSSEGDEEVMIVTARDPVFLEYRAGSNLATFPLGARYGEPECQGTYHLTRSPTPLKLSISTLHSHKTATFQLSLLDPTGQWISSPIERSTFSLSIEELRTQPPAWELGEFRVDGSLFARQKARWAGQDLFFAQHGGSLYAHTLGKERIDFPTEGGSYSCFVGLGDILVWDGHRWQEYDHFVGDSLSHTILVVKRIEEKMLMCEVWHPLGVHRINITLVKMKDSLGMPDLTQHLRFVGAKTWSQFIIEADGKRLTVKPRDWLLCTEQGWMVLDTIQKLDDYVEQRLVGALIILDHIQGRPEGQVLSGSLFNISRTECIPIEIPATLRNLPYPSSSCIQTLSLGEVE